MFVFSPDMIDSLWLTGLETPTDNKCMQFTERYKNLVDQMF